jgi:predicted amidophosphoribosyltransferase
MFKKNEPVLSAYEIADLKSERTYRFREKTDVVQKWLRSCAVCTSTLPPIDLVCDLCWAKIFRLRNQGPQLLQKEYPFPVYSLFTWTEETEPFIKPFIHGFKRGFSVSAAQDLALEFLNERMDAGDRFCGDRVSRNLVFIPPPSNSFDHGTLWTKALAERCLSPIWPVLQNDLDGEKVSQKHLNRVERHERRFGIREQIAGYWPLGNESGRLIFADDVITTGSTAMAAFMALGDPEQFEVWTLVARPRIATH